MKRDLITLTVYPGLKKLRLEFTDSEFATIIDGYDWKQMVSIIKEMKETYDDFLIQDVVSNTSYRAGRKVK